MKLSISKWLGALLLIFCMQQTSFALLVSDAGTASASLDSVCPGGNTTLMLTGYTGTIQWQSYDGSMWIDETNPGATTDMYVVAPSATTDYRAVVTDAGFPPDTSNVVTITVGLSAPAATPDTRCGYGPVTLTASGSASTFRWYDVASGGTPLYVGSSFTTNVAATTTFYVAASSSGGSSATAPIPPHNGVYTGFTRGYWFTSPIDFTITSVYIPTDASTDNQSIAVLKFPIGAPPVAGNNVFGFTTEFITQNNPIATPILVSIPVVAGESIVIIGNRGSDTLDDFAAINSYDAGGAFNTDIDGNTVALNRCGMQSNLTGYDPDSVGLLIVAGSGQRGRIEFGYEVGCESGRTPVVATVTPSDPISISAVPPALCQGQSSAISVSSNNANYAYTWSPATGLSGTTGTSNTATPMAPITYVIIADDGTCGAIDSVFMDVGPASAAGTAAISSDTICLGTDAFLTLTGFTGNIQWQGNDGSGWVNETGTGSTTANYTVSPPAAMTYRAVVTSGGCDPDTSISLDLSVITITDPIGVNDTICAPGTATLTATGPGVLNWYTSMAGGTPVHTGPGYSPTVSNTTTFYVEAAAGSIFPTGAANLGIGSQLALAGNDFGLQFNVIQQCVIEQVYISPGIASGNITINLKAVQGGPVINTVTVPVVAFSGLQPVNLGFTVNPGTGYRLELASGSVQLYYNSTGAVYPYAPAGSPINITNAVNPNPTTAASYYFFYNWQVKLGCASNLVPVTAFVNAPPPVPTVMQNGTILTSSAASGNQWNLNGVPIPGATGVTYDMGLSGSGSFTVTVTVDGCSSTSQPVVYVTVPEALHAAGISLYPNPVNHAITITFSQPHAEPAFLRFMDMAGKLQQAVTVDGDRATVPLDLAPGVYMVEISVGSATYNTRIMKN